MIAGNNEIKTNFPVTGRNLEALIYWQLIKSLKILDEIIFLPSRSRDF